MEGLVLYFFLERIFLIFLTSRGNEENLIISVIYEARVNSDITKEWHISRDLSRIRIFLPNRARGKRLPISHRYFM